MLAPNRDSTQLIYDDDGGEEYVVLIGDSLCTTHRVTYAILRLTDCTEVADIT